MSTAQILFEQYKILPPKIKAELRELIFEDEGEMVDISLPHLMEAIEDIKLLKEGKAKTLDAREALEEIKKSLNKV